MYNYILECDDRDCVTCSDGEEGSCLECPEGKGVNEDGECGKETNIVYIAPFKKI